MSAHAPLDGEVQAYLALKEWLIKQHDLAEDDEAIPDTLEGITTLNEAIVRLARIATRREAMGDAMAEIVKANQERRARHVRAAAGLRGAIANAMSEAGLKKAEAPDVTISYRLTDPKCKVVDQSALPEWAVKVKTETVPDQEAIKKRFEMSQTEEFSCPGVVISNGAPSITIRTR